MLEEEAQSPRVAFIIGKAKLSALIQRSLTTYPWTFFIRITCPGNPTEESPSVIPSRFEYTKHDQEGKLSKVHVNVDWSGWAPQFVLGSDLVRPQLELFGACEPIEKQGKRGKLFLRMSWPLKDTNDGKKIQKLRIRKKNLRFSLGYRLVRLIDSRVALPRRHDQELDSVDDESLPASVGSLGMGEDHLAQILLPFGNLDTEATESLERLIVAIRKYGMRHGFKEVYSLFSTSKNFEVNDDALALKKLRRILKNKLRVSSHDQTVLSIFFDPRDSGEVSYDAFRLFLDFIQKKGRGDAYDSKAENVEDGSLPDSRRGDQNVDSDSLDHDNDINEESESLVSSKSLENYYTQHRSPDTQRTKSDGVDYLSKRSSTGFTKALAQDGVPKAVATIINSIRRAIQKQRNIAAQNGGRYSFSAELRKFADMPDSAKYMTRKAFHRVLKKLPLSLSKEEIVQLIRFLSGDLSDRINWHSLLYLVKHKRSPVTDKRGYYSNSVLLRLRRSIEESIRHGVNPTDVFEVFDPDQQGHVRREDFGKASTLLGCSLTTSQIAEVDKRLHQIAPNTPPCRIDYQELLGLLKVFGGSNRSEFRSWGFESESFKQASMPAVDIQAAIQRMQHQLYVLAEERKQTLDVMATFEIVDRSGDGTVSYMQFVIGLNKLGIFAPVEDIKAVASLCSDTCNGPVSAKCQRVNYRKFFDLLSSDEALACALRSQLRGSIRRGCNAWTCFKVKDPKETGLVSRVVFREVCLSTLSLRMRECEMQRLMEKFSNPGISPAKHKVNYVRFLEFVDPNAEVLVHEVSSGLELKVREAVRKATYSNNFMSKDRGRGFRFFESSDPTHCTYSEFLDGLKRLRLSLDEAEKRFLITRFDDRGDGRINYVEFVKFAGFSEFEMDCLAAKLSVKLSVLRHEGVDCNAAFEAFDCDRSGTLSRRAFCEAVRTLGLPLATSELFAICERFQQCCDPDVILYKEFLRFASDRGERVTLRNSAEEALLKLGTSSFISYDRKGSKHDQIRLDQEFPTNGYRYDEPKRLSTKSPISFLSPACSLSAPKTFDPAFELESKARDLDEVGLSSETFFDHSIPYHGGVGERLVTGNPLAKSSNSVSFNGGKHFEQKFNDGLYGRTSAMAKDRNLKTPTPLMTRRLIHRWEQFAQVKQTSDEQDAALCIVTN